MEAGDNSGDLPTIYCGAGPSTCTALTLWGHFGGYSFSWAVCGAERAALGRCLRPPDEVSSLAEVDTTLFIAVPAPLPLPEEAGAVTRLGIGAVSFVLGFRRDTGLDRLAFVGFATLGLAAGTTFGRLLESCGDTGVARFAFVGFATLGLAAGTTFGRLLESCGDTGLDPSALVGFSSLGLAAGTTSGRLSKSRGNGAEDLDGVVCSTASCGVADLIECPPTERAAASVDVTTAWADGRPGVADVVGSSTPVRAGVNVTGKSSAAPWPSGDPCSVVMRAGANQSRLAGVGSTPGRIDQVEIPWSNVAEAIAVTATSVPVRTSRMMSRSVFGTVRVPARHTTARCATGTDSAVEPFAVVGLDRRVETMRLPAATGVMGCSPAVGGSRLGHDGDVTIQRSVPATGAEPMVSAIAQLSPTDASSVTSAGDWPSRTRVVYPRL